MTRFGVELAPPAVRAFKKLPAQERVRIRRALEKLATQAAARGWIGGKSVKTIQGIGDSFHRLRVGDHRVMYDVLEEDRAILVLGIAHRGDLEHWLRNR